MRKKISPKKRILCKILEYNVSFVNLFELSEKTNGDVSWFRYLDASRNMTVM